MAHSKSKTKITDQEAAALVREAFGSGARLAGCEELTDGYYNAAYALRFSNDSRYVLKIAPPAAVRVLRYEHDIMAAEVKALRLVRQYTEMPVPEVICYDRSRRLIPQEWFLMPYLPGAPLHRVRDQLAPEAANAIDVESGRLLRQVNSIPGPAFGYLAQPTPPGQSWRTTFLEMIDGVLADGADIGVTLPDPYDAIRERVAAAAPALDEITEPRLVHWDLWDGNMFVDPATARITGVIDFERALWGDPLLEVNFGVFRDAAAFYEGYGRPMLATPAQRQRRILYNIYLFLIMVIECYYREYETPDQENYARRRLASDLQRIQTES
jgi:aminoglycoside phosphotransferase (APT) family kinase protein